MLLLSGESQHVNTLFLVAINAATLCYGYLEKNLCNGHSNVLICLINHVLLCVNDNFLHNGA